MSHAGVALGGSFACWLNAPQITPRGGPLVPSIISHYKIFEKLGERGIAVVYKAEDPKLDCPIALKFLPSQLNAASWGATRLKGPLSLITE